MKVDLKSYLHLAVQYKIKHSIPSETFLEHHFKKHIADVYWKEEKIVFEVQCSPISVQNIKKRNAFYATLGFCVIWILHEKTFNEKTLSPAEEYLIKQKMIYYTNVTQHQNGIIYTQKKFSFSGHVLFKSPAFAISLSKRKRSLLSKAYFSYSKEAKKQLFSWFKDRGVQKQIFAFYKEALYSHFKYYFLLMQDKMSL